MNKLINSCSLVKIRKFTCDQLRLTNKILNRATSTNINTEEKETKETTDKIQENFKRKLLDGPNLRHFFKDLNLKDEEEQINKLPEEKVPYLKDTRYGQRRKVYFDVYGCQMNVNDTEIIWSILKDNNFLKVNDAKEADIILIVTCSIRDSAEEKIWNKLGYYKGLSKQRSKEVGPLKIGILGCMAERLKHQVLEKDRSVDLVAGPDSYRDLPRLLALTENNQKSVNVLLSLDETYADIMPVRLNENSISAFVSIMRGCDNMCTYCIVPFTRGRERSRPVNSILREVEYLSEKGVKEVTLLGQNVNSYRDLSENKDKTPTVLASGFKTVYKPKLGGLRFADLLERVSDINPNMRIRFTSPHPKDFPDEVLDIIKSRFNICKNLHIPAQSGNSAVLERMRRGYTREAYLNLIENVRKKLPDVALSSDFICGFCGETDEEFEDTITLMELVKYNTAYLFPYSMREKTTAHRRYIDDVSNEIKHERLMRMVSTFRTNAEKLNRAQIGKIHLVLIEGYSKRSKKHLAGRNDQNIKVIIPAGGLPEKNGQGFKELGPGDYAVVQINSANSQVLKGIPLYHTSLSDFYKGKFSYAEDLYSFHGMM